MDTLTWREGLSLTRAAFTDDAELRLSRGKFVYVVRRKPVIVADRFELSVVPVQTFYFALPHCPGSNKSLHSKRRREIRLSR